MNSNQRAPRSPACMDAGNPRQSPALTHPASYGTELGVGGTTLRQRAYLLQTPPLSASIVARAFLGTASPRQVLKAKCLSCANWQRDEIESCTVETCPIWRYRPFQKMEDA